MLPRKQPGENTPINNANVQVTVETESASQNVNVPQETVTNTTSGTQETVTSTTSGTQQAPETQAATQTNVGASKIQADGETKTDADAMNGVKATQKMVDVEGAVTVTGAAPERDCLGIKKGPGRPYFYIVLASIAALLISIIAVAGALASDDSTDQSSQQGSGVNGGGVSPTLRPTPETAPSAPDTLPTLLPSLEPTTMSTQQPTATTSAPSAPAPTTSAFVQNLQGSKPNIMFVLLDDLGYHDVGYVPDSPRAKIKEATAHITKLAEEEGVILTRMYAHWHCSPSRRSFLTGRLPHRTGEDNSDVDTDDIDIRWSWISDKLKSAGYMNYMLGKGHTGYLSANHLPTYNGFDEFVGILTGKTFYTGFRTWQNGEPEYNSEVKGVYSTRYYRQQAIDMLTRHQNLAGKPPFFMFLSLQTPHTPIHSLPDDPVYNQFTQKQTHPYEHMLYAADIEINEIVQYLKTQNLWNNTLFIFSSDNGATLDDIEDIDGKEIETRGSNYPLRGDKSTNFEGGMRATAFVSGGPGVFPEKIRGTQSAVVSHIADWYATFCYLAGVDPSDDPPVEPSPIPENFNVLDPSVNIWGTNSYPGIDSKNLIPHIMDPDSHDSNSLRPEGLVLTIETIILGDYKLITAQPCPLEKSDDTSCKRDKHFGWIEADAKTLVEHGEKLGCLTRFLPFDPNSRTLDPCLFNLADDPREERPITNEPEKLTELWLALNESVARQYNRLLPGKGAGLSPTTSRGNCVTDDRAAECWDANAAKDELPLCGIPGCRRRGRFV